jgi:hypothetical protein
MVTYKKNKPKEKLKFQPKQNRPADKSLFNLRKNNFHIWALTGICILVIIIRLNFLTIPFERDEGAYSYYGQLILAGKTPYISFYETKPPGLFYIYALLQLVFGKTVVSLHLAGIVLNLLTIILIFLVSSRLLDKSAGLISAASFSLLSLSQGISGFTIQAEHIVIFFAIAGLWMLLKAFEKDRWILFLIAGMLLAMSFMIKQNGLFFLVYAGIVLIAWYVSHKPVDFKKLFINGSVFSAGALLLIAFFVFLIYMQNAMTEFWKWVYVIPKSYTSQVTFSRGMTYFENNFKSFFADVPVFIVIAAIGFLLTIFVKLKAYKKIFIILFPLFSFVAIMPGFWFYNHYFLLLTPSIALCIGSFVYSIRELLSGYFKPAVMKSITTAGFLIVVIQNLNANQNYYFNPDYTEVLRRVYGMNPFPEAWEVSKVVKDRTVKGDIVGVLGGEPEVFIYTGRKGPSAHDMAILLYSGSGIRTREWQKAYIADVEKVKPKYFICFNNSISLMTAVTDTAIFNWFDKYMADHYRLEGIADMIAPFQTKYLWDKDVENYKVQNKYGVVYTFKRKEE